ncbi:MAG: hypothetical protein ABI600_13540 [Luteolibacter sp.]
MNSDPHENAAWRTFGMLDADEATGFDEAMRDDPELRIAYRDMNGLSAAVAAATVTPIIPRAGQLERLQSRLGLHPTRHSNWIGITGWAAAAALTVVLIVDRKHAHLSESTANTPLSSVGKQPMQMGVNDSTRQLPDGTPNDATTEPDTGNTGTDVGSVATQVNPIKVIATAETQRLTQEIETLRGKLDGAQKRDQKHFETIPGMAWPIIMTMSPPGNAQAALAQNNPAETSPPLTSIIGDALAGSSAIPAADSVGRTSDGTALQGVPSAIPIYDAARHTGTLVVSNLPATNPDERYNLWVNTENGDHPTLVGQLPASSATATEPYDFSLGTTAIIPTGFILTKDTVDKPSAPSEANTILMGPH